MPRTHHTDGVVSLRAQVTPEISRGRCVQISNATGWKIKILTATKKEMSQCYLHKVTLPVEAINIVTTGVGN